MIVSTLAWGLGYFGMPHILTHFMAIEDDSKLALSRRVGSIWCVVSLGVAVIIGIIGYSMLKVGAVPVYESASAAESLMVNTSYAMASKNLFLAVIGGIIISGILAATMSTADAQLLGAASGVTHNLMTNVFGIKVSDKTNMLIARLTVIAIAALGVYFASDPNSSIFRVVSFAWAGFGATFGPVMLFGLFWKRCNKYGAIAGMLTGAVMIFVWKFLIAPMGGVWAIYELLPAFIVGMVAIVVVSLLTAKPETSICETFDTVKADK
jgi:sodium/proline symporter